MSCHDPTSPHHGCAHHHHDGCHHETCHHDHHGSCCSAHHAANHPDHAAGPAKSAAQRPPIKVDFDTQEWAELMAILEEMDDQTKACALLAELNEKSAAWGKLFMNLTPDLKSADWKAACDKAQKELLAVIAQIKSLA